MAVAPLLLVCLPAIASEIEPSCQSEWIPLHTGNYWVYRSNSRFSTGTFRTVRVLGPYEIDGRVWCQLEDGAVNYLLRAEVDGRVFRRNFMSPLESVVLDPRGSRPVPLDTQFGVKADVINLNTFEGLISSAATYARNVGKLNSSSSLATGSSGGFTFSDTLLEFSVDGRVFKAATSLSGSLTLELDEKATNCAVPCYYAACGLGSPVDPPGAQKPCLSARVVAANAGTNYNVEIVISSSTAEAKYVERFAISNAEAVNYRSLPFYIQERVGQPIALFPSGDYLVVVSLFDVEGNLKSLVSRPYRLK